MRHEQIRATVAKLEEPIAMLEKIIAAHEVLGSSLSERLSTSTPLDKSAFLRRHHTLTLNVPVGAGKLYWVASKVNSNTLIIARDEKELDWLKKTNTYMALYEMAAPFFDSSIVTLDYFESVIADSGQFLDKFSKIILASASSVNLDSFFDKVAGLVKDKDPIIYLIG